MKSIVASFLAVLASVAAIGFFVWQTQLVIHSLDRLTALQDSLLRESISAMARTEREIREVRDRVRFLSVDEWLKAVQQPLARSVDGLVARSTERAIQSVFQKWSEKFRSKENERWQQLFATVREGGKALSEASKEAGIRHQQEENWRQSEMEQLRALDKAEMEREETRDNERKKTLAETDGGSPQGA